MSRGLIIVLVIFLLIAVAGGVFIWYRFFNKVGGSVTPVTPLDCLTPEYISKVKSQIEVKQARINQIRDFASTGQISLSLREELTDLENDVVILKKQLTLPICPGGSTA